MSKKEKKAVVIYYGNQIIDYDVTDKDNPVPMDEKYLRQYAPDIERYTDAHKWKTLEGVLDKMNALKIEIPSFVPNAQHKLRVPNEKKRNPTAADLTTGARGLLNIAEIWENPFPGFWLTASLLTAMHTESLRRAGPDSLFYATEIRGASKELVDLIIELICMAVTKDRWKKESGKKNRKTRIKMRRKAVLDYRNQSSQFTRNIRNFAEVKVKWGKRKAIRFDALYEDTISVFIEANGKQLREALPLMNDAGVILINCVKPDGLNPHVLKASDMDSVFDMKIQAVQEAAPYIAAVLRWWWAWDGEDEDIWAAEILRKAKEHLEKPNGDYVSISPNPVKLRHAVYYEVFCNFLEFAAVNGFLSREEAEQYRDRIQKAFYPEPVTPESRKRIEDPAVFPDLMRSIAQRNDSIIIPDGKRFVKSEKKFGAIRVISGEQYLVMPENTWATAYKKAAKDAGFETSFCQTDGWERNLQKILSEADLIKHTGSNPRYRYDLYDNGKKDTTYVVAVLWDDVKARE